MDEKQIEALVEDVRLIVHRLRSSPTNSEEDAACRAIHRLYSTTIKRLVDTNEELQADNSLLRRHIVAENEAAQTIINRLSSELEQIIEADEAQDARIREVLTNADLE